VRFGKAARILRRREFLAVQQRGQRLRLGRCGNLALDGQVGEKRLHLGRPTSRGWRRPVKRTKRPIQYV